MLRSLYTAGRSMISYSKQVDIISNNIANINTNAYKKDTVIFESFSDVIAKRINDTKSPSNPQSKVGNMQFGSDIGEVYTYYDQGQALKTDKSLDLSIDDSKSAFFTVGIEDNDGNIQEYYTRDGSFAIDSKNCLITNNGNFVLGAKGIIKVTGENFNVLEDGTVKQDGKTIDKLLIKEFKDTTTLRKHGKNLVSKTELSEEQKFTGVVRQGFLEQSNVNIVREMVDMVSMMRSYETSQKIVQSLDSSLEKTVNELGAVK